MANILTHPTNGAIYFDDGTAGSSSVPALTGDAVSLNYDGSAGLNITSYNTTSTDRFSIDGDSGRLFSVNDSLTGTIFSVNDAAGLPIIEVESTSTTDTITMGTYASNALVVAGDRVGIGTASPSSSYKLDVTGDVNINGDIVLSGKLDFSGNITAATSDTDTFVVIDAGELKTRTGAQVASDIGLGNVTNESKATMFSSPSFTGTPSAPTASANTNTTQIATTAYVQTEIGELIGGAPAALDTLNELAAAIGDDASYASSITTALAAKAPLASPNFTGDVDVAGSITTEGPDGGMVMRTWTGGGSYGMIGTANMSSGEYSLLTDGTSTYLSGGTGGNVYIRGGNNDSSPQITVSGANIGLAGVPSKASEATAIVWDGTNIGYRELGSAAFSATSAFAAASHTQAFSTITSTPTTVAGYGITDAVSTSALSSYLPLAGGTMTGAIDSHASDSGVILKSGNSSATGNPDQFFLKHNLGNVELGNSRGNLNITSGNVGIGTTSPSQKLTVEGNIELGTGGYIYGDTTTPNLRLSNAAGALLQYGTSSLQNGGSLQFVTASGTVFRVNSGGGGYFNGGNVGIGDTTPSYKLDVAGDIRATGDLRADDDVFIAGDILRFTNDAASAYIQSADALILEADYDADDTGGKPITFKTAGTTKMTIAGGGNVGIGTTSPSYPFSLESPTTGLISRIYNTNSNGQGLLIRAGATSSATRAFQVASADDTKIMTVNSNGNVGIGTTSPASTLEIEAPSSANGTELKITSAFGESPKILSFDFVAGSTNTSVAQIIGFGRQSTSGGPYMQFKVHTGSTLSEAMRIDSDGNVGIGKTNPSKKLDVAGDIRAGATVEATRVHISTDLRHSGDEDTKLNFGIDTINLITAGTTALTVDSSSDVTVNNDLVVSGNLTVNGTTSTINSTTVQVDDKNIELGTVATPTDTTADGGGITLKGATDKTINWVNSTDAWTFSDPVSAPGLDINGAADISGNLEVGEYILRSGQGSNYHRFLAHRQIFVVANASSIDLNNGVSTFGATGGLTTLQGSSLLLDSAADITIDAGGQDIILSDDGTIFGTLSNSSGLQIRSRVNNADMYLRGVDGGTEFTALRLDMSAGGVATFSSNIIAGGAVYPAIDAAASLGLSNKRWAGLELSSSSAITWGNGDAEIIEGETNNYSLTFKTYDGSANSAALRLDGDNTATFTGNVTIGSVDASVGKGLNIGDESPTIQLFDTTNNAKLLLYTQDSNSIIGTYSNHALAFYTNSTQALNLDVSQNATFAGSVTAPNIQLQSNLKILNKAQTAYLDFATRNTSDTEVKYDLGYVGRLTFASGSYLTTTSGNQYIQLRYGSTTAGGLQVRDGDNALQGYLYADGASTPNFGLLDGSGSWAVKCRKDEYVQLLYDGAIKLQTASGGVSVTGLLSATTGSFSSDVTVSGDLTVSGEVEFSALNSASASPFVVSDGGTLGTRTAAEVLDDIGGRVTKKISGDGTTTTFTVTHSFGTPHVMTQLLHYGNNGTGATYEVVQATVKRNSDNAIDVVFGTAPTATEDYLVLITKMPAIS